MLKAPALNHLLLLQPSPLLKRIYPQVTWNMDRAEPSIYLTFDDGPIPVITEWILDLLKDYDAKSTFFCVGANIQKNPAIYERILQEGHSAGNHTMFHSGGFKTRSSEYLKEAAECRKLVNNHLFRPPHGQLKPSQYKALIAEGYRIILWDVISYDYEKISPEKCAKNVLNNARNGSIVLFHDNVKAEANIRYALPLMLRDFSEKGFRFKRIEAGPLQQA
jgi:peptidoglycan/xylan/chitin deacetylase (PgdA/CDA1 family)